MNVGTYAVERDYSHYTSNAAKTILAVVGTASKGPIGVATECTSSQDFVNKFGSLNPKSYGLYAGQYFLSQSSKLYYVRAAGDDAAEATATIAGTATGGGATVEDALVLKALEKGTYANGFKATITAESGKYTLNLYSAVGNRLETHKNFITTNADGILVKGTLGSSYIKIASFTEDLASLTVSQADSATTPITFTFSGGDDGIEDIESSDYISAAQEALRYDAIDMNLFSVPGISDPAVITAMLELAETRGDCLYLVDPPEGLERDGVIKWHNGEGEWEHAAFNSSYGALYYDWVNIYDSVNKTNVLVPPSVPVAASIAYSDRTSDLWYAPAGLTRGIIRGVLSSDTKLSKADIELLYGEDNNINAIYEDPSVGLVILGQKTLSRTDTATNRVNVRRLMNYLKRVVAAACEQLTFEPNDRVTWNRFEMLVKPTLESVKNRRGLYEYKIYKGDSVVTADDIDDYRMPCVILVRPTKAAETIPIYFVITSTGADFNEVLEANGIVDTI